MKRLALALVLSLCTAPVVIGLALLLSACTAPVVGDTRSQQQIAFDDACWSVKAAEATFTAFNSRGAIDATGVEQFNLISSELDATCAGPIPADMRQFAARALVSAATIVALAVPKAQ